MALLTIIDLKTEFNKSDDSHDDLLLTLAESVQSLFGELTNRTIESATFTEFHGMHSRNNKIFLKNIPVISITSIHDDPDWDYGDSDLLSSDDYTFNADSGIVYYDGFFFVGNENVKVTYVAGYTVNTLPEAWKQIWIRQAMHWFSEAKNKTHGQTSVNVAEGSTSKKELTDGLLPEFNALVEKERL
jgi:hypothetical protein